MSRAWSALTRMSGGASSFPGHLWDVPVRPYKKTSALSLEGVRPMNPVPYQRHRGAIGTVRFEPVAADAARDARIDSERASARARWTRLRGKQPRPADWRPPSQLLFLVGSSWTLAAQGDAEVAHPKDRPPPWNRPHPIGGRSIRDSALGSA